MAGQLTFNDIGIDISIPSQIGLLSLANLDALRARVSALVPAPAGAPNYNGLRGGLIEGRYRLSVHSPANHSFIRVNGHNCEVVAFIGAGAYGSIYTVLYGGNEYILKIQRSTRHSDELQIINEALINHILGTVNPEFCNKIYRCVRAVIGGQPHYCFILQKLAYTLQQDIQNNVGPVNIGTVIGNRLCTAALHLKRLAHHLGVNHGDLKPDNMMLDATGQLRLIDFGFTYMHFTYEGTLMTLQTQPRFNSRVSYSRDMTNLIYYIWNYNGGDACGINDRLRPLLQIPNPNPAIFSRFDHWDTPHNQMIIQPGAPAALTKVDNSLAPMYSFFNYYDNPLATYENVQIALACPHVGGVRLKKRGSKTRKHAKRSRARKSRAARR